jgi:GAF domain-containing protein
MTKIHLLIAVRRENAGRYYKQLNSNRDLHVELVTDVREALEVLDDNEKRVDVLVLDNNLENAFALMDDVRHTYPRLLIVSVDEEADFALPGQADEVSTDPFSNDDLVRRITRLMSDRQLETLRADAMPAVREFAKQLRKVTGAGELGKQQAAVSACHTLGFDYVAFYRTEQISPLQVVLRAQEGDITMQSAAPKEAGVDDIVGWVAKTGQSRIAAQEDVLNHPFVTRGRMGAVAAVPVTTNTRYGVLVVCRQEPNSITQDNVLMLELVAAQLAAAASKDALG